MLAGLFPGQGSQQVGMGKSFYDEFSTFRNTFEEASDSLGLNLKKLCFDGPESDLTLTENAQPAILAVSTGCYRVAHEKNGITLNVTLGHSLGEYSALVAAGAIPFSSAIKWVRARGLAMQEAVPVGEGGMAAILGDVSDEQINSWCKEAITLAEQARKTAAETAAEKSFTVACTVEPANFNAPGQLVVSGSADAVDALEAVIKEKNIRGVLVKKLNVSAPFHCSLMKPARTVMEKIFIEARAKNELSALKTPYIPNRSARMTSEHTAVFELLSEQVDHSVLWKQSVETLFAQNYKKAYEFGGGKVLQGLAKRIAKPLNVEFEVIPIFDVESLIAAEGKL